MVYNGKSIGRYHKISIDILIEISKLKSKYSSPIFIQIEDLCIFKDEGIYMEHVTHVLP